MGRLTYLLIVLILGCLPGFSQNNGVFGGGEDDGYTKGQVAIDRNNTIFGGGVDDGYDQVRFTIPTHNGIFGGGIDDGYTKAYHSIDRNNGIFTGGIDDGYDQTRISIDRNNDVFGGGEDDGYDLSKISIQTHNDIFTGGIDDGYTVFTITGLPLRFPPPFPIELLSFDAWPVDNQVQVQWVTTHEVNLDKFVVERSQNGLAFESLTEVKGQGGPQVTQPYETVDPKPYLGTSYYRLKSVDMDGTVDFSRMVEVFFDQKQGVIMTVFPNPTSGDLNIRISSSQGGQVTLSVLDLTGRKVPVAVQTLDLSGALETRIDLSILPEGMYILQVNSLELGVQKVMKIRKY